MLGREARTQYAAMARLRWRIFVNGLRSIHGILDLGATGIACILYSIFGLGLGTGLCAAAYSLASRASWQYLPILFWAISYLWLMFPVVVASFQEQSDLGILLRFPVHFGSYFLLYLISGLMEASTFVGALFCFGVWLGIVLARPDLYLWAALSLSVFAVFNILLVPEESFKSLTATGDVSLSPAHSAREWRRDHAHSMRAPNRQQIL
jgi:ABC-2 type transport system permease protein